MTLHGRRRRTLARLLAQLQLVHILLFLLLVPNPGSILDLNPTTAAAFRVQLPGAPDVAQGQHRQPTWKPQLQIGGKQRVQLVVRETVSAALYDREEVNDEVTVAGVLKCRFDLEGLPEVQLSLVAPETAGITSMSINSCAQVGCMELLASITLACKRANGRH